jgi:hypothetical protein
MFVPNSILQRLPLNREEVAREHWFLTDPILLDIARQAVDPGSEKPSRPLIIFNYSPLVVDPLGMIISELGQENGLKPGFLTIDTTGKALPGWSESDRQFIMAQTVNPYHQDLGQACLKLLASENMVALVTLRSFFTEPQRHERHRQRPRPQVCLGSSTEHTPQGLAALSGTIFRALGLWPQLNWPLTTANLPELMTGQPRLKALNIGLRRDLYMDEKNGQVKSTSEGLVRVLKIFFDLLEQELNRVARLRLNRASPPKKPSSIIKDPATQSIDRSQKPYMTNSLSK